MTHPRDFGHKPRLVPGLSWVTSHDFPKTLSTNDWSLKIMSHINDCPAGRSQFLTRGSLFQSHVAKVYVFDRIRHGTALEILS